MTIAFQDPAKKLIVELCKRITLNGNPLNVLTEFSPENEIPCLTMNDEPATGLSDTMIVNERVDSDTFQKVRWDYYKLAISTHAWSYRSSEERDYIINELERVVREAKLCYYQYCGNYDINTHICSTTGEVCDAYSMDVNGTPSVEFRCPYPYITDPGSPYYRNPRSWFSITRIFSETFQPRGGNVADEMSITPPAYHKYIIWDYECYIKTIIPTNIFTGINGSEDIILD